MHAYSDLYLTSAQRCLGGMLDFAANGIGMEIGDFHRLFVGSQISIRFAAGEPAVIAGKSGAEIVFDLLGAIPTGIPGPANRPCISEATPEYWTGWALAFYQWASGATFASIERLVPIERIRELYNPYHEMDVRQFCDHMDELVAIAHPRTKLQARRLAAGLSQSQLATAAGVPVRTLQQYEQRQKDLNRARADYVESLARALCCLPADLMERRASSSYDYAVVQL